MRFPIGSLRVDHIPVYVEPVPRGAQGSLVDRHGDIVIDKSEEQATEERMRASRQNASMADLATSRCASYKDDWAIPELLQACHARTPALRAATAIEQSRCPQAKPLAGCHSRSTMLALSTCIAAQMGNRSLQRHPQSSCNSRKASSRLLTRWLLYARQYL